MICLRDTVVVTGREANPPEIKAAMVLIEEVRRRTGLEWELRVGETTVARAAVARGRALILLGTRHSLAELLDLFAEDMRSNPVPGPEGFEVVVTGHVSPVVIVLGADARGVLYGVGTLLRRLWMEEGVTRLDASLKISTFPRFSVRGHQLGYRPLNNTYDAWTPGQFDQYIRELALFGANTIELVPPGADDASATAPHMKLDPIDMMVRCCRICEDYGLNVSLWYPNEGRDYESPRGIRYELDKREEIFRALPRLDALFIPAGDPGKLEVNTFFVWAERVAGVLRKYHPKAQVGISSQGFRVTTEWLRGFYLRLSEEPEWLDFVVFAPWERDPLPVLRERVPSRYPIRHYPDITHTFLCQYPVPLWDPAFARTEGRECINPRPRAMKHIHNFTCLYTAGSITYSEGVNDDVNKFVWAGQDWDPSMPVETILGEYARFFIDPGWTDDFVRGVLALEENWNGPLAANAGVEQTLTQWLDLEARVPERVKNNWRFQQAVLRACFDAYVRRRLLKEQEAEQKMWKVLREAVSPEAIEEAKAILNEARPGKCVAPGAYGIAPDVREGTGPAVNELRRRCFELADALWENIGEQLSVERHHASRTYRGAFLDTIDAPLNDVEWLSTEFDRIRSLRGREDQLGAIRKLVARSAHSAGEYHDTFLSSEALTRVRPRSD
ncbi:MAG: hypothetical protein N2255_08375, partial [Kiritimatiellae bacterium]|nr:hypothetical protein [Kiritimatiellia bacterium]